MITHTKQEILDILDKHPYFVSFLQKNKLYFKYIHNAMNPKWGHKIDEIKHIQSPKHIINFSFLWSETKEGHIFWNNKELEYIKYYKEHNEI